MADNLMIVESPAKARTIEKFLGKDFKVQSCFGHVRDLPNKQLAVDTEHDFTPQYTVPAEKQKIVNELKKAVKKAREVWLATDEDREGEAISWHLCQLLGLDPEKTKRITFHEITKQAIREALEHPRSIDMNLVNAQQARRVLDRLVGFEISPLLWKKIKLRKSLSAGRVQSVALRLIVERENEIRQFRPESFYRVNALFHAKDNRGLDYEFKASLPEKTAKEQEALALLEQWKGASFVIADKETKPGKKSPAPPFTTSTLQQEASRKLGFSVSKTMTIAQHLYENGHITYMRTDSVNLSDQALHHARQVIEKIFGSDYAKTRKYRTKSKSAQEAHEAIRPTYFESQTIDAGRDEKRLYELIWKRTLASQMSDAELEKTEIRIKNDKNDKILVTNGEVIVFEGFLKVYGHIDAEEQNGEEGGLLPPLRKGQPVNPLIITATQRFTRQPPRYTEATLVRKLEELGIGRPSTYAKTIKTIQDRGYVEKKSMPGTERDYIQWVLETGNIRKAELSETYGQEKNKLFPTDIGELVNQFLLEYFSDIFDYSFTASIEEDFDRIANGKAAWNEMIRHFYQPFHQKVNETLEKSGKVTGDRLLGNDPETGKPIIARMGKFGPMVQIGEGGGEEKPRFAKLLPDQSINTITLEEALKLFALPRELGAFEDEPMVISQGKYGPYIRHGGQFYSIPKGTDPFQLTREEAIKIIREKRQTDRKKVIREFPDQDIRILNGPYGPYIKKGKRNYRLPAKTNPESLTLEQCLEIIEKAPARKKSGRRRK